MDEEQITQTLLAELGLACLNAQALEDGMASLFAVSELVQKGETARPTLRALLDARYVQTLGRLINDAAAQLGLSLELTEILRQALQQRNWLVHHFYREHGHVAFNAELKVKVTEKLRGVRYNLESAIAAVNEELIIRLMITGRSREEIKRICEQVTNEYIQRDLAD